MEGEELLDEKEISRIKIFIQLFGISMLILIAGITVLLSMTWGLQLHNSFAASEIWNQLDNVWTGG